MSQMHDKEAAQMMQRCVEEIEILHTTIQHLQPKAHAYDTLSAVVRSMGPRDGVGHSPSLTWELKKKIQELQAVTVAAAGEE